MFKMLMSIGKVELGSGRETMNAAWNALVKLHFKQNLITKHPWIYLIMASLMHARTSLKKSTSKELDFCEKVFHLDMKTLSQVKAQLAAV